jgi:hypothetical protein
MAPLRKTTSLVVAQEAATGILILGNRRAGGAFLPDRKRARALRCTRFDFGALRTVETNVSECHGPEDPRHCFQVPSMTAR